MSGLAGLGRQAGVFDHLDRDSGVDQGRVNPEDELGRRNSGRRVRDFARVGDRTGRFEVETVACRRGFDSEVPAVGSNVCGGVRLASETPGRNRSLGTWPNAASTAAARTVPSLTTRSASLARSSSAESVEAPLTVVVIAGTLTASEVAPASACQVGVLWKTVSAASAARGVLDRAGETGVVGVDEMVHQDRAQTPLEGALRGRARRARLVPGDHVGPAVPGGVSMRQEFSHAQIVSMALGLPVHGDSPAQGLRQQRLWPADAVREAEAAVSAGNSSST